MCASPQIANPQIFIINLHIANPRISTNTSKLKTVLKVIFQNNFFLFCTVKLEHYLLYFCKEKMYVYANLRRFWFRENLGFANRKSTNKKSATHKMKVGPANSKSVKYNICGRSVNLTNNESLASLSLNIISFCAFLATVGRYSRFSNTDSCLLCHKAEYTCSYWRFLHRNGKDTQVKKYD